MSVLSGKWLAAVVAGAAIALSTSLPARADFELVDSVGRRILLMNDGTWRYVDAKLPSTADVSRAAASGPGKGQPEAELRIATRRETPGGCAFELRLRNQLPMEIGSLVPEFRVFRDGDVVYSELNVGFGNLKPGDEQTRDLRVQGLSCAQITRLQVIGGDRCVIGELNKFTEGKGLCLARVRVLSSDLIRFEK